MPPWKSRGLGAPRPCGAASAGRAHRAELRARHNARCLRKRHVIGTSARARSLVCACAACAWSSAVIPGVGRVAPRLPCRVRLFSVTGLPRCPLTFRVPSILKSWLVYVVYEKYHRPAGKCRLCKLFRLCGSIPHSFNITHTDILKNSFKRKTRCRCAMEVYCRASPAPRSRRSPHTRDRAPRRTPTCPPRPTHPHPRVRAPEHASPLSISILRCHAALMLHSHPTTATPLSTLTGRAQPEHSHSPSWPRPPPPAPRTLHRSSTHTPSSSLCTTMQHCNTSIMTIRARRERGRRGGGASERRRVHALERRKRVRQRAHRARYLVRARCERGGAARTSPVTKGGTQ